MDKTREFCPAKPSAPTKCTGTEQPAEGIGRAKGCNRKDYFETSNLGKVDGNDYHILVSARLC